MKGTILARLQNMEVFEIESLFNASYYEARQFSEVIRDLVDRDDYLTLVAEIDKLEFELEKCKEKLRQCTNL